jgi:hypothetical protein
LRQAIASFKTLASTGEPSYTQLEIAANRYQQWAYSNKTHRLRLKSEQALPIKSLPLTYFLLTDIPIGQLSNALYHQDIAAKNLLRQDRQHNAYHLATHNCVTALFNLMDEAVSGQSTQLLGGFIDPQTTFIPFQSYDAVQKTYHVVKTHRLPSYRQQGLTKMYHREVDSWVYTRESNIFSSRLYKHNQDDAWFVFFTDDTIIFRPFFGAVNTLAATSQSLLGLLRWPFDGGKQLQTGVRGLLASLPELAFFNIRKGSYPYPIEP